MNATLEPSREFGLSWHRGPLASYDCETSGVDTAVARIVTAALVRANGQVLEWLSDLDGAEIPEGAYNVHKVSTEYAHAHGRPAKQVVEEIADAIAGEMSVGRAALVVMNAPFDLPLLDAECARHGVATVDDRIGCMEPVIDPLVLDRHADRYRRGKRTLEALAAHYGVALTEAHTAKADALAALEVAVRIGERYPEMQLPAHRIHMHQVHWHADWAANFQQFLRGKGETNAVIDGSWPLRPVGGAA
ncbi:exonuclease domain-containing protein [Streptomyces sp. ME08-AFT2]|uniref:exonuclease domain-containing protein n=1 Tax=Streptomyces sp. ME08-AFT2 TaxID=3028683 RepID=UPI0029A18777|nr:exonuclease domain-containing protein [Streptomyces sp. ME08-AFT2]MDX3314704.1 exonuclease domain-containing protein [Streptomyces sp. ME08-AFT2]